MIAVFSMRASLIFQKHICILYLKKLSCKLWILTPFFPHFQKGLIRWTPLLLNQIKFLWMMCWGAVLKADIYIYLQFYWEMVYGNLIREIDARLHQCKTVESFF